MTTCEDQSDNNNTTTLSQEENMAEQPKILTIRDLINSTSIPRNTKNGLVLADEGTMLCSSLLDEN